MENQNSMCSFLYLHKVTTGSRAPEFDSQALVHTIKAPASSASSVPTMLLAFLGVALSLPLCFSKPVVEKRWDDFAEKHSWPDIPQGWVFHATPHPDTPFNMRIALKENDLDGLISSLYEVSDPFHSRSVPFII